MSFWEIYDTFSQNLLSPIEFKLNVKEKGKVNDNTAKMQSTNQLGV